MIGCGFVGAVLANDKSKARPQRGIYPDFHRGGNPPYERLEVAERIAKLIRRSPAAADTAKPRAAFTLFAWPSCGFCTKARAVLEARGIPYEHVVIDKYSAEHAELAMSSGRCSVPYIFGTSGELLGGFDSDDEWPGLIGALAAMDSAEATAGTATVASAAATAAALMATAAANDETLPQAYFESLDYEAGNVPWDLEGRPQPPVRNACEEGEFGERGTAILDCGCGAGDNANWLAARGYDVLGFDLSASAVATARARASSAAVASAAAAASGATEYVRASATELRAAERVQARAKELGGFEVALDSAMMHCLDDDAQRSFVDGVRPLMRRGGRLFVGCFSDANPNPWSNPRRLSEAQLRSLLSVERGWQVLSLESAWYERPSERAASGRGAWTMAWWCVAQAV